MPHTRAEVFWQIPHRRDRQDDEKARQMPGGMGTLGIDWAITLFITSFISVLSASKA